MGLISLSKKAVAKAARFREFQARVLKALREAGFTVHEVKRLERIMDDSHKRTLVFIQALLTSLKMAGIPPDDLNRLKELFNVAYENILADRPALTDVQNTELIEILTRNRLSVKAAYKLSFGLGNGDETLAQTLSEQLSASDITITSGMGSEARGRLSSVPRRKAA